MDLYLVLGTSAELMDRPARETFTRVIETADEDRVLQTAATGLALR